MRTYIATKPRAGNKYLAIADRSTKAASIINRTPIINGSIVSVSILISLNVVKRWLANIKPIVKAAKRPASENISSPTAMATIANIKAMMALIPLGMLWVRSAVT